jgi:hypothetical protein
VLVLGMRNTTICVCGLITLQYRYIRLKMAGMSSFMLSQLTLKNSRQMPSLPGAFLQASFRTDACNSSALVSVSSLSVHVLAFYAQPAPFEQRFDHLPELCRIYFANMQRRCANAPRGSLFTSSVSITLVIKRDTSRFRMFRRWKIEGCSP